MIPYTTEARGDTGVTNVTMGVWLFLASEVMLFGSLFSAYALLRVSATTWPSGADVLSPPLALVNTALLLAGSAAAWRARGAAGERAVRRWLAASAAAGVVFLMVKALEYRHDVTAGLVPSASTFLAAYFTLTGLHAAHVVGGVVGNVWAGAGAAWLDDAQTAGRVRALSLYWGFVDVVWIVILVLFYLT